MVTESRGGRRGGGRQGRGGRGYRAPHNPRGRRREGTRGRSSVYRVPQLPSNPSNLQFIRSVLKNCPNYQLEETIQQMETSWLHCWQEVETLPVDALQMLLSALARLPFSARVAPPLPAISKAVSTFQSQVKPSDETAFDGNDETLEGVKLVESVVSRLLKFTWDLKRDDVKQALDEMIVHADTTLNIRLQTHRSVRSRLTTLLNEMEKSWSIRVKVREVGTMADQVTAVDWRHPTMAWLGEYKNFQPALLPKLQLPRTNEGSVCK